MRARGFTGLTGLLGVISLAFVHCAAGTSTESLGGGTSSGNGGSGASSGNGGSSNGGGSGQSNGGQSSSGQSSGSPSSSGPGSSGTSSSGGDDSGGTSSGADEDGGGTSSGTSSGSSGAGGSCTPIQRGAAPTSDSAAAAGPYQTMSYAANASVRMTDAYDVTSAHIYYPVGATPPYASLPIVPGFLAQESSIADWGPFLASWGFVVMTIGTSNSTGAPDTSVDQNARAAALLDALTTIKGENTRSGSPLSGQLDLSRLGVAGWSKGGGGTLIDANTTPSLKAVFAMEPWNVDNSGNVGTYPNDTVPTLMFAGTADGLAGPPMPQTQYMSIPATTPKLLYEITGGSHYVSTSPTNSTTDMAPDSMSTGNVARFGLSWLKVFMECDDRFRPFLLVKPSDAAEFDTTLLM
jgi:dienelactone hydrolase